MRNFQRNKIFKFTNISLSFIMFTSLFGCDIDVKNDVEENRDGDVEDKEYWKEDDWEEEREEERENLEELWNHCEEIAWESEECEEFAEELYEREEDDWEDDDWEEDDWEEERENLEELWNHCEEIAWESEECEEFAEELYEREEDDWEEDESPQQECHDFYDTCLEVGIDEEICIEGWLDCISGLEEDSEQESEDYWHELCEEWEGEDCETLSEELEEEDVVDTEGCESDFEECLMEGNSEAVCTEQYEDCISS